MLLRRLGAIVIVAVSLITISSANFMPVRFASVANSAVCSARQLIDLPPRVDVAFLGSSRIRRGLSPEIMRAELGANYESIFNLGRPGRTTLRSESILNYLLSSGRIPKVVVLETEIGLLQNANGMPWNFAHGDLGFLSFSEVSEAIHDADPSASRYQLFDAVRKKIAQAIDHHVTGLTYGVLSATNASQTTVCWLDAFDIDDNRKKKLRQKAAAELAGNGLDPKTSFDDRFVGAVSPSAKMEIAIIDRIRDSLASTGAILVVVRPNAYLESPMSDEVIQDIQGLIPEFQAPPENLARKLGQLTIDHHHFGPEGRKLYTEWLAGVIKHLMVQS